MKIQLALAFCLVAACYAMFDEEDFLDDGSGGPECFKDLRQCRRDAKGFKEHAACMRAFVKCKAGEAKECVQACLKEYRACRKDAEGIRGRFKCLHGLGKCFRTNDEC